MPYEFSRPRVSRKVGRLEIREDWHERFQITYSSYATGQEQITLPIEVLASLSQLLIDFAEESVRRDTAFARFREAMGEEAGE